MQHNDNHKIENAVEKAGDGNTTAMSWLYNLYVKEMYNTCLRMMGSRDKADDIFQKSFITAFSNIRQLKNKSCFQAWLKKIIIHNCLAARRTATIQLLELKEEFLEVPEREENDFYINFAPDQIYNAIYKLPE